MLQIYHFQSKRINLIKIAKSLGQVSSIRHQHQQQNKHVMGNYLPSTLLEQYILAPDSLCL